MNRVITVMRGLRMECLRASKRFHEFYRWMRTPLHGLYFCVGAVEAHSLWLAAIPIALLVMLAVGVWIEEKLI